MKKIIFTLLVLVLLALAGCTGTTEDTDETGVGYGAPSVGGKVNTDTGSSFFGKVRSAITRDVTEVNLEVPSDPLQEGAFVQAELVSLKNGIADLQVTYSVPETVVRGLDNNFETIIDVQVEFPMSLDAIMQDFGAFIEASTSQGTINSAEADGTTHSGTYGEFSGEVTTTNPDGSTSSYSWDNDKNNNGVHDSQENGISPESERFPIVMSQMMIEVTNALATQENTLLILENMDNLRGLNSLKVGLAEDMGQNLERTLGDSFSVEVTSVQVV
jgi:hypothetical protein